MTGFFQGLVQHPLLELTGWTIVHSFWQGIVIAVPLGLLLRLQKHRSASSRYLTACVGLLLLFTWPLLSFTMLVRSTDSSRSVASKANSESSQALSHVSRSSPEFSGPITHTTKFDEPNTQEPMATVTPTVGGGMEGTWMSAIAALWLIGISLMVVRLCVGVWCISSLRRRATLVQDTRLNSCFSQLIERMKFRYPLLLLESVELQVPVVMGALQPVIIVPTSFMTGFSISEVESILAHELAHVRRWDWLVNLVQSVIEVILFYHPIAWWISGEIRRERENCCDDVAIAVCGDPVVMAKALLHLDEARCDASVLAMSARGGSLIRRIRRLVLPMESKGFSRWNAGLVVLVVSIALVSAVWMSLLIGKTPISAVSEGLMFNQVNVQVAKEIVDAVKEIEWGKIAAISGVQTRLTLQTDKPQVGKPLLVKLEIRNAGKEVVTINALEYTPYEVLRVDVPRPGLPPPSIGFETNRRRSKIELQPGEVYVLWENVDVSNLFFLNEPRNYEIIAEGLEWAGQSMKRDSNPLEVRLLEGELPPAKRLMSALMKMKPKDWGLVYWENEINLDYLPNRKTADLVRVSVRFSPVRLEELVGFQTCNPRFGNEPEFGPKFRREYIGQNELGFVYLLHKYEDRAKELWPSYSKDIIEAVNSLGPQ